MSTETKVSIPEASEEQQRGRLGKSAPRGRSWSCSVSPGIVGTTFFAMLGTWAALVPGVLEHLGSLDI